MLFGRPTRPASPPTAGAMCPDDGGNRIDFRLRDLGTRSVRLSPLRAHVTRDVNDVHIEPGTNHITIIGLSPTVDEHSIKVEGVGPAFISDIAVQLVPNRDIFEEVYPDSDDESDSSPIDSDSDNDSDEENDTLIALREELGSLFDEKRAADELIASAEVRLKILDAYSARIAKPERPLLKEGEQAPPEIPVSDGLEIYRAEREKAFRANIEGKAKGRTLDNKIDKLRRKIKKEVASVAKSKSKAIKEKEKATKAKEKGRASKLRKEAERAKEKLRIRRQREATWPRNVYAIRVTLETATLTPGSTRRSSVSSDIAPQLVHQDAEPDGISLAPGTCRLTLSYMTTSAFWSPAYDLSLSTITNSASLYFDALLTNHTSEIWSNCKVSLTTSQAESYDLTDKLPFLQPWRVELVNKNESAPGLAEDEMIMSISEIQHRRRIVFGQKAPTEQQSRWQMFGVDRPEEGPFNSTQAIQAADPSKPSPFAQVVPGQTGGSLFGAKPVPSGGLFGNTQFTQQTQSSGGVFGSFGTHNPVTTGGFGQPAAVRPAGGLFGAASTTSTNPPPGDSLANSATQNATTGFGSSAPAAGGGLFGSSNNHQAFGNGSSAGGGLFGGTSIVATTNSSTETTTANTTASTKADLPNNNTTARDEETKETFHDASEGDEQFPKSSSSSLFNTSTSALPMSWGEDSSSFIQMGLTSNHDLPGLRTLMPSAPAPVDNKPSLFTTALPSMPAPSGSSRHRVTRITSFTEVDFTRTVIGKYKPAAYLRVKLRNGSKIPIFAGQASITLDGSFLGRMQIPPGRGLFDGPPGDAGVGRGVVRPGEYMHLDLGIDPAIRVTYTGPSVKNGKEIGGGYLSGVRGDREVRKVYTRTVTLFNGREHGAVGAASLKKKKKSMEHGCGEEPVKVLVLDQIPTTEDERLKIKILKPAGLSRADGTEKVDVKGSGGVLSFFSSNSTAANSKAGKTGENSESDIDSDSDEDGGVEDDGAEQGDSSWGGAQARMMPSGQVEWDVTLKPSRMVKLVLEYEFIYPKEDGVKVVNAN